ncbi:energy transducer TonB [Sporomusa malonica]|uniref:Outer membrane transport energization protein TonB n=1 Tax=Sporomusa malonica TaxID=112901 RepID=A0A1W2EK34_9FIRM|nr:energy transducer TonB [Sporomusa malonica]SMD10044.1 outer membrane transport energization protein TonB [Sporomusa malonica]
MDWTAGNRWRKAMAISFLLHSLVLFGVGLLTGKALVPAQIPEMLIELELVSESDSPPLAAAPELSPTSIESVRTLPQPTLDQPIPAAEPAKQAPVVAVSAMAVVAVDSSASASASAPAASGGSISADGIPGGSQSSGGNTGKSGASIPPGILSRREPAYPEPARQAGIEGTVVLRIEILENGRAGQVSIYKSSGSGLLDAAAVAAVQHWRFVPAKMQGTGQSIACQTTMPVVFKLKT